MRWRATYNAGSRSLQEPGTLVDPVLLYGLMTVKVALQYFLIHPSFDLHRDEYLHLDQADHLAWGFISLPPLTSWVAWVIKVLGNDVFWVKFFPGLFGAMTIYFAWKIIEQLSGGLFAKVTVSLAIMFSAILRLNILFQPNSFEVMSWTACYFFLVRYIRLERPRDLYLLAFCLGMSFLNKYNVIFLMGGVGMAWLMVPQRRLLFSRHLPFAIAVFLLIVLPNLLWQYDNGIPFIKHMKELTSTQLVNMSRADFVKEQFLFFLNSFFLIVLAFIGFARSVEFRRFAMVPLSFAITVSVYIWFRAKGYYAMGLYPVLLAFGAVYLEVLTARARRYIRVISILVILLLAIPLLRIGFPYMSAESMMEHGNVYRKAGLLKWEDGREHHLPQDFADMRGWRELAYITDSAVNLLGDKDRIMIIANNYGQAGAINYYGTTGVEALSFNADYLNWFPAAKPLKHVIRVMDLDDDDDDPDRTEERSLCDTLILAGEIRDELARERGTRVYVMKNVKDGVWERIMLEVESKK